MIDIHCHILPGLDDGARDIYDVLEMATIAQNCGVKAIVATPHCNIPGTDGNYYGSHFREVLQKTREAIAKEQIALRIISGMEVFVTFDLPDLIREGRILTINHSGYLLMEFDFDEDPEFVDIMVDRIGELNITPVIAHPERYEFIKEDIEFAHRLVSKGCVLQANKGSFLGKYGTGAERTAFALADADLLSVVASDAHSPHARTPYMTEARRVLQEKYDIKKLFEENPQKICMNQSIK